MSFRASRAFRVWQAAFALSVGLAMLWALLAADFSSALLAGSWFSVAAVLFLFCWFLLPLGLGLLWRWNLRWSSGLNLTVQNSLVTQGLAWGGRYLPGKAGLYAAKIGALGFESGTKRTLAYSVLVEQVLFVIAGAVVALVLLPWPLLVPGMAKFDARWLDISWLAFSPWWLPSLFALALGLIALTFAGLHYFGKRLKLSTRAFSPGRWGILLGGHVVLHLVVGLGLYPLVKFLLPETAAMLGPWGVAAALALANTAGILAFFAPAGLGVRELVLAFVLALGTDLETALAVSIYVRLVSLLADLAFFGVSWFGGLFLASR